MSAPLERRMGRYVVLALDGRETVVHAPYEVDADGNEAYLPDEVLPLCGFPPGTTVKVFYEGICIDIALL